MKDDSTATTFDNSFDDCKAAVVATKATVISSGKNIKQFQGTAIIVKDSRTPAHVYLNMATSGDLSAKVADVQGPSGTVEENSLKIE